jgi:hypothetical protein
MRYDLDLSDAARETIRQLDDQNDRKVDKVRKTLALMETNIKHQGLHTHSYAGRTGNNGEKVFEAYVENHAPGAYRIYWHYGPGQAVITIIAITPHPE